MNRIFYKLFNPESNKIEVESINDFKEIKENAITRGINPADFEIIEVRLCGSKKQIKNFEKV